MHLQMINHQAPLKRVCREDGALDVFKVWTTIQGEGPFAGRVATFVRLYGCNLQCTHCDTDYTSGYVEVTPTLLLDWVRQHGAKSNLIVLTGGEPLRQNVGPFCRIMGNAGYHVQIETNGTLYQNVPIMPVTVVCSPKTPHLHSDMYDRIEHLKYVLSADAIDPKDGLPLHVLGDARTPCKPWAGFKGEVWLQPEDTQDEVKNKANLEAVRDSCLKHGYRVCLQTHKLLGVE